MKMILAEDIVSVTDFARGTKEHLAEMSKTQRPRVLTQNGKAAAVPVDMFDEMAQKCYEREMDMKLKTAQGAYAKGDLGRPLDEVFGELRTKNFGHKQPA